MSSNETLFFVINKVPFSYCNFFLNQCACSVGRRSHLHSRYKMVERPKEKKLCRSLVLVVRIKLENNDASRRLFSYLVSTVQQRASKTQNIFFFYAMVSNHHYYRHRYHHHH